jgi:hypothetical protein
MNDDCLTDLTVLAIERSSEINFEKVKDAFANNHKNSRIILRWYQLFTFFYNKDVVAIGFLDHALWITSKLGCPKSLEGKLIQISLVQLKQSNWFFIIC